MTSHGSRESLSLATYLFVFCWLTATAFAAGPKERTLYGFQGAPDGINPQSTVIAGGGHLYGTTIAGGTGTVCQDLYSTSCGTVFELTPPTTPGGSWTEKVLYNFQGGSDGAWPSGKLMRDITGNLYGTTMAGGSLGLACTAVSSGATGCGTVFRLSPPQTAGADWTESILYVFQGGLDGKEPFNAGLISDGKGNLYGTTALGGDGYCYGQGFNCGTVFRLSPSSAAGGPWTETILYSFNGNQGGFSDGDFPAASLVFDQKGKLYGTTVNAGPGGCSDGSCGGTVFRLSPPPVDGTLWTETVLYGFGTTNNDSFPSAGVLFDKRGNLYGTTKLGGSGACDDQSSYAFPSCGTVFSLNPTTSGVWTLTDLYSFTGGSDGGYPEGGLTADSKGNLYGIAPKGGGQGNCTFITGVGPGCGTAFELMPPVTSGGAWTEITLHAFSGGDGATPNAGLILKNGVLYGTTSGTGTAIQFPINNGTVFAILP